MKIIVNPDQDLVREIKKKLRETNGYCPCVNPKFWNEDTKCMCKAFREQLSGECHCGLYIKEE